MVAASFSDHGAEAGSSVARRCAGLRQMLLECSRFVLLAGSWLPASVSAGWDWAVQRGWAPGTACSGACVQPAFPNSRAGSVTFRPQQLTRWALLSPLLRPEAQEAKWPAQRHAAPERQSLGGTGTRACASVAFPLPAGPTAVARWPLRSPFVPLGRTSWDFICSFVFVFVMSPHFLLNSCHRNPLTPKMLKLFICLGELVRCLCVAQNP